MKAAAVNADFRHLVAGQFAARLLVYELPKAIVEAALAVLDAVAEQTIGEAERAEFAHGVRQQRYADAEFLELRRALVYAAGNAAVLEIECERQPANAAADDCYFHSARPIVGSML